MLHILPHTYNEWIFSDLSAIWHRNGTCFNFIALLDQLCWKDNKLEIWGKAQRESARRPKSDSGKLGG